MKSLTCVINNFPTSPYSAACTVTVMTVIIPGLQTGSAALKHLQFVSNFGSRANHCVEQNLSRHIHSERLRAIMIRFLTLRKKERNQNLFSRSSRVQLQAFH